MVEELDSGENPTARYTQGLGIDEPLAMYRGGVGHYYHADGLRSVTSLTDSAGNVAASYVYDSFGNLTDTTGELENPFRYTAREFDSDTGSHYYRARYYDPAIGRFLSEDPIAFAAAFNFFPYVGNNPVRYVDFWGLCRITFDGNQISIETNDGRQKIGPFPAANRTVCDCGLKEGVYPFDPMDVQWLYLDGKPTPLGASDFDGKRTRREAFGDVRIPGLTTRS